MQFHSPSVVHAVPGVTAPVMGVGVVVAAGDVAGVGVGEGVGMTMTVVSATWDGVDDAVVVGEGATTSGVEEAVTIGEGEAASRVEDVAASGEGEGVAIAFALVGVISAKAPPGMTTASEESAGVADVADVAMLTTGVGTTVVAIVTGSGELVSGMLPVVPVREATVFGSQELGPELQPSRRFAMSEA